MTTGLYDSGWCFNKTRRWYEWITDKTDQKLQLYDDGDNCCATDEDGVCTI